MSCRHIGFKPGLGEKELAHVADHELSHGIMQSTGQIQNRGFGVHPPNEKTMELLRGAVKDFEGNSSIPPELLNELRKAQLQQRVQLTNPYAAWLMSSGEAIAEQSAFRTTKAGRLGLDELQRAPEFSPSYISDQASIAAGSAGWPVSSQGKSMTQEVYNTRLLEELRRQAAKSR